MKKLVLFCYAKLIEPLFLLRRNILRRNNSSEAKAQFLLLLRRRITGLSVGFPLVCFAETVLLKSGQTVEGKIVEKTDKEIKIDLDGVPLTYFFDEIESIDGQRPVAPPDGHTGKTEKEIVQKQGQTVPSVNNTSATPDGSGPEPSGDSVKGWKAWYPEVKDYLNGINQFVVKASHISKKVDSVVNDLMSHRKEIDNKNASEKTFDLQMELDQAIGGIDSVINESDALQPPQELRAYHSCIEKFLQYHKSTFIALMEFNAEETQKSRTSTVEALRDSFRDRAAHAPKMRLGWEEEDLGEVLLIRPSR